MVVFLPFLLALLPSLVQGTVLSYDPAYDNAASSLTTVACSDGDNGLITRGFTTFGSLPKFPNIGGIGTIEGWNSRNCGTCHQLTYIHPTSGEKRSIDVLAIDKADNGFNIALEAMNELTGKQGEALGRVNVAAKQVAASVCGLV